MCTYRHTKAYILAYVSTVCGRVVIITITIIIHLQATYDFQELIPTCFRKTNCFDLYREKNNTLSAVVDASAPV